MNETRAVKRLDIQFPQELVPDRDGTVQRFDSSLSTPLASRRGAPPRVLELDDNTPAVAEQPPRDKAKRLFTKLSILIAVYNE